MLPPGHRSLASQRPHDCALIISAVCKRVGEPALESSDLLTAPDFCLAQYARYCAAFSFFFAIPFLIHGTYLVRYV